MASTTDIGPISSENPSTSLQSHSFKVKRLSDFVSNQDRLLIAFGFLCALIHGFKWIVVGWVLGNLVDVLSVISLDNYYSLILSLENDASSPRSALDGFHSYSTFQQTYGLNDTVASVVARGIYRVVPLFGITLLCSITCYFTMNITLERAASNQVKRIKVALINSLLQQDMDWFDHCQPSKFVSQTENDFIIYQDCIGFKLGFIFSSLSSFIFGFIYCMILEWRLALIGYSTAPLCFLAYSFTTMVQQTYSAKETKSYSKAGIVAEDVLTAFKTVIGYNGQNRETVRYCSNLISGRTAGIVKSVLMATGNAFVTALYTSNFALIGWFATYLYMTVKGYPLQKDAVSNLISIFMVNSLSYRFIDESFSLANHLTLAKPCGKRLLEVINKIPSYDRNTKSHVCLTNTIDKIEFIDVEFSYSSRTDIRVLQNFNLQINKGEKVALVGSSGSGKSTVISLLHRFYDPKKGSIRVNGCDIKELNLGWLQSQIGVVSQEPVLFPTTIYENIRYGYGEATKKDIETAAKMANAHQFIMTLPLKYETNVGDRGTQMSGGQKQRIAIARALVRKPPILLLDEATSALDSQSELIVQQALDNASVGRTSVIIAHRLSTIRNADKIVVMSDGQVVESGNHDSLMEASGVYYQLVKVQESKNEGTAIPKVIINESENRQGKIGNEGSTDIKTDIPKMFAERKEFQSDLNKLARWKLPYIQNTVFFRLLTIGGYGPIFMCLGMLASIGQGLGVLLTFIRVLPAFYYIFDLHELSAASMRLHTFLLNIVLCGILLVTSTFHMILFFGLSGAFIAKRLRSKMFDSLMRQEVSWYDQSRASVGNLCLILSHDVENVKMTLSTHLGIIVTAIVQTISGLVTIFLMSWVYGCVLMIFYIMALAFPIYTKQKLHRKSLRKAESSKFSNEMLREVVMNIRTIRFLGAEDEFKKLYLQKGLSTLIKKRKISSHHITFMEAIIDSIAQLANFFILLVTPMLFVHNEIVFIQFFKTWGAAVMTHTVSRALCAIPNVSNALISLEKIFNIIDQKLEMENAFGEKKILASKRPGTLVLDDVSFSYPTRLNCKALDRFNINIKSHQTIAIVGSSGSGKSTCVQLAARFYDPQSGHVIVCGEPTINVQHHSLRAAMAIVQQEPMVFNRSIAENIAYGDLSRDISMEEIVEAAKIACAHDFISKLPQGYETMVGNRGTQISGGQKQRIAIARAVIRKAKLLLLDEATSALDSETEKEVQLALRKTAFTVVVIAHRLSTITDADQIIVVHQGTVVETGKHNELMDLNGFYACLYRNQINN